MTKKRDLVPIRGKREAVDLAAYLAKHYESWTFDVVRIRVSHQMRKELDAFRAKNAKSSVHAPSREKNVRPKTPPLDVPKHVLEKIRIVLAPALFSSFHHSSYDDIWAVKARRGSVVVKMMTEDKCPLWLRQYRKGEKTHGKDHTSNDGNADSRSGNDASDLSRAECRPENGRGENAS